jgi:hypothetical protein
VMKPEGPSLPGDMLILLLTSLAVFTVLFLGLFLIRYSIESVRGEVESRAREATVA